MAVLADSIPMFTIEPVNMRLLHQVTRVAKFRIILSMSIVTVAIEEKRHDNDGND
jgi:hypothetical protein